MEFGISPDAIEGLANAARSTGVAMRDVTTAFSRLQRGAAEALAPLQQLADELNASDLAPLMNSAQIAVDLSDFLREHVQPNPGEPMEYRGVDGSVQSVTMIGFQPFGFDDVPLEWEVDDGDLVYTFGILARGSHEAPRTSWINSWVLPWLEQRGMSGVFEGGEPRDAGADTSIRLTYRISVGEEPDGIVETEVASSEECDECTPFSWCDEHDPNPVPTLVPIREHPQWDDIKTKPKKRRRNIQF